MPTTIPTQRVDFLSGGTRCAAWVTLPPGAGPHPAVVLVHGFGATHDMMLPQYEQHFAAAGIATLAFDYRNTGASDGQPRQHISLRGQRADVTAALDFVGAQPEIDAGRVGLWGTSLGGMSVLRVAAARNDVAVAVIQCPMVHGPAAARSLGVAAPLRLAPFIAEDALRALLRRRRRYVPIVGPPGSVAVVTVAGAEAGWNSTVPLGGQFENRVAAADAVGLVMTSALRHAHDIAARPAASPATTTPITSRSTIHRWSAGHALTKQLSCRSISMSVRELLRENDVRFRALAHGFSADDWLCPSLCERWTNHAVLAHLVVGLSASLHSVVGAMVGHRGSFDSANAEMARTLAAVRSPAELLDDYQRLSHQPRGMGRYFRRVCFSATTSRMNSTWSSHWTASQRSSRMSWWRC